MDDQHIDGNGVADLLREVAGADMTAVVRACQSCGADRVVGEHRAYRTAGVVLRCPACDDIAVVIGVQDAKLVVEWRGTYALAR